MKQREGIARFSTACQVQRRETLRQWGTREHEQMSNGDKKALGKIALQKQAVPQEDAAANLEALRALSEKFGVPGLDLTQVAIPLEHLELLPREIATRSSVLPVLVQDENIFLAMANPEDKIVIDELEFVTGKRVFPYVTLPQPLAKVIEQSYERKLRGEAYYLGPNVPHEVLERLGLASAPEPPPAPPPVAAPPVRQGQQASRGPIPKPPPRVPASPTGISGSFAPPTTQKASDPLTNELVEGDFSRGSELSRVEPLPVMVTQPSATSANRTSGPTRTILVVDDEEDIRRLLRRVLTDRGFRVIEADRGTTALALVKEHTPNLIVLDAMLPELHGFEIARRLRGTQKYGSIPIVMMSAIYKGWRYAEDLKQNYGVENYIEKPFRITEMLQAIEGALLKQQQAASAGSGADREKISAEAEKFLQNGIAAYQSGDIELAIRLLKQGCAIDALAYRLHYHLGLLYGKKGQLFEAIQALETAVEINGRHFPALKNLAVLYQKAGFKMKAIDMWTRSMSCAPDEATKQGIKEHLVTLL